MALRDTLGRWLRSLARRFSEPEAPTTSDDTVKTQSRATATATRFTLEHGRREVVAETRKMYEEDDRVEAILATLARDCTHGGFTVEVSGGISAEAAQEAADALLERLELTDRLDDWARLTFRDGDSFLEVGVTAQRLVAKVTRKPTLLMHRNSNSADEFEDPERAYWLGKNPWMTEAPEDAIWFADWQVVHARWAHDEGQRYGRPMFKSARTAYKRMREGELDMAIRRKTRAGLKMLHVIEGADDGQIQAYRERNKEVLNDPFAAVADYFTNKPGSIQTVQGDTQLGNIEDVTHHIETFWVASPVPMSLLGYGRDLNRDVLEEQKEQYDEQLPTVTRWVETQLLKPLLELQWLLAGIWPPDLEYRVVWNVKKVVHPRDIVEVGQGTAVMQGTGLVDDLTLLDIVESFLPAIDFTRAREELEERLENESSNLDQSALAARQALDGEDGDQEEPDPEGDPEAADQEEAGDWLREFLRGVKGNGSRDPAFRDDRPRLADPVARWTA